MHEPEPVLPPFARTDVMWALARNGGSMRIGALLDLWVHSLPRAVCGAERAGAAPLAKDRVAAEDVIDRIRKTLTSLAASVG